MICIDLWIYYVIYWILLVGCKIILLLLKFNNVNVIGVEDNILKW